MTEGNAPRGPEDIKMPEVLPILPLFNVVVFPKMILPLEVGEESSLTLIDEAMAKDRQMGIAMLKREPQSIEASIFNLALVHWPIKNASGPNK